MVSVYKVLVGYKVQTHQGGCISCLGISGNGLSEKYLPIQDLNTEQRIGVCSAFTPYAVSGGMMASSLGVNMILEWLEIGAVKTITKLAITPNIKMENQ
ncbi:Uncharacterised protein [Actinobacillus equuli]|nr:Uncharacterised protein [Actinobacillus equuli]